MNDLTKINKMMEHFQDYGIIPVVVLNDSKNAEPLAKILCEEKLSVAEVTFRTDAAEDSISIMSKKYPEMIVGAGTVLNVEQAERAVNAGAKFIVSPGLDVETVKYCIEHEIPICPGTQTASEMMACLKLGLKYVKFFPAEQMGGLKTIKAITSALVNLKVMPTGGVNPTNAVEYLKSDKIFCVGGSWMVKSSMIEAGEWDQVRLKVKEAVKLVKSIRG